MPFFRYYQQTIAIGNALSGCAAEMLYPIGAAEMLYPVGAAEMLYPVGAAKILYTFGVAKMPYTVGAANNKNPDVCFHASGFNCVFI